MRKLSYEILIPPLCKPFKDMTPVETDHYFSWYVDQVPHRVEYLATIVSGQMKCESKLLDLSPDSLIILWRWFLRVAEIERNPNSKSNQIVRIPLPSNESLYEFTSHKFTLQTEYIMRDIGMYLGQVFVKNHPGIFWGFYETPKSDFFVNMPVLIGFEDSSFQRPFKLAFEPTHMVRVQAANIWDGSQNENDLYSLYKHWLNMIPGA